MKTEFLTSTYYTSILNYFSMPRRIFGGPKVVGILNIFILLSITVFALINHILYNNKTENNYT